MDPVVAALLANTLVAQNQIANLQEQLNSGSVSHCTGVAAQSLLMRVRDP